MPKGGTPTSCSTPNFVRFDRSKADGRTVNAQPDPILVHGFHSLGVLRGHLAFPMRKSAPLATRRAFYTEFRCAFYTEFRCAFYTEFRCAFVRSTLGLKLIF